MRKLFFITAWIVVLASCTKEKPLEFGDYTALRSHLRAHFEVFALTESLSKHTEFGGLDSVKQIEGGAIDTLRFIGSLKYNDSRSRNGRFQVTFDQTFAAPNNHFHFELDYYRDSLHITGYLDVEETAVNQLLATKHITGVLEVETRDGIKSTHEIDMVQKPEGQYDYEYTGKLNTKLSSGDTAFSETLVPIKNTAWDGSNLFSFIRPWFGESTLYTSKQKGKGRMVWGYRPEYQFRDDFLYVGFPEDNDLQLNMRMQLY
jgi:hypothetical protein